MKIKKIPLSSYLRHTFWWPKSSKRCLKSEIFQKKSADDGFTRQGRFESRTRCFFDHFQLVDDQNLGNFDRS